MEGDCAQMERPGVHAGMASLLTCRRQTSPSVSRRFKCGKFRVYKKLWLSRANSAVSASIVRCSQLEYCPMDMTSTSTSSTSSTPFEPRIGRSVSLDQAAQLLGVSRRTVYNRIREGRLQTIRTMGGSQRVLLESVHDAHGHS